MKENKKSKKRFTMMVTADQLKELKIISTLNDMTMKEFVDNAIRNEIKRMKLEK